MQTNGSAGASRPTRVAGVRLDVTPEAQSPARHPHRPGANAPAAPNAGTAPTTSTIPTTGQRPGAAAGWPDEGSLGPSTPEPEPPIELRFAVPTPAAERVHPEPPPLPPLPSPTAPLRAMAAHTSVGVEWDPIAGASGYRLYVDSGVDPGPDSGVAYDVDGLTFVHRGLTDGTTYNYALAPLLGASAGAIVARASATPWGRWVLEELGSGLFDDVKTGDAVARVPLAERIQVLVFADGYTEADLPRLHDDSHAGSRDNDLDRWVDEVFAVAPYDRLREAFVIWYLPLAAGHIAEGSVYGVLVYEGPRPSVGVRQPESVRQEAWYDIGWHPVAPRPAVSQQTRVPGHVAVFLIFDASAGRAGYFGRAMGLLSPRGARDIQAAFGMPYAHEFTHAFSDLRDEYLHGGVGEVSNAAASNVAPTNECEALPWAHLLYGAAHNPEQDELVGAFGTEHDGFHPELTCLLNGVHDNAREFGGSGDLRTDRLCNFCREMTTYRILEHSAILPDPRSSFETWVGEYRAAYYSRFGLSVPTPVPQTNDVLNPELGVPIFQDCVPATTGDADVP